MKTLNRLLVRIAICCTLVIWGCASAPPPVVNLQGAEELAGKNVLAGQLRCYSNDEQVPCIRGWRLHVMGAGDEAPRPIVPDGEGFVYFALEPGTYKFPTYTRSGMSRATFHLNPFLEMEITPEEEVVNFGTLEFHYVQGTGSKIASFLVGVGNVYLQVEQKEEYEAVEALLRKRLGNDTKIIRKPMTSVSM